MSFEEQMSKTMIAPEFEPAPESTHSNYKKARSRTSWAALVLGGLGLFVAFLLVVTFIGSALFGLGRLSSRPVELIELPPVAGAPEADIVMNVTPIGKVGDDIDANFVHAGGSAMGQENAVVSGTTRLIATVGTPFGTSDVYTWTEVDASTNPAFGPSSCFGMFSDMGSGTASCGDVLADGVEPLVGSGSSTDENGTAFDVSVRGLPADASWVVVKTQSGYRVASAVTEGIAYMQWQDLSDDGPANPVQIVAMNDAFDEVWSAPLG